ncbi:TetR/AcrR family transcriptional regulator [Amycolatopsis sp. NPDC004368]
MSRLSRAESQNRNREHVLQVARTLFLSGGYRATSLAAVADAAGFSTGVVYSNFSGKPELALQVLHGIQAEQAEALAPLLDHTQAPGELARGLREWAEQALASGWPRFELEFALDTRADPAMVAAIAERQRFAAHLVTRALRRHLPEDLQSVLPLTALADAVVDLMIGFAVRRLIDPDASLDQLETLLRAVLGFRS